MATQAATWAGEAKVAIKLIKAEEDDKEEAESAKTEYAIALEVPRAKPTGTTAFTGARIITMNGDEVIDNGTVVITDNRIAAVGAADDVQVGYAILDINPQKDWQYYANLAYGVTTTHDPSASTHMVFSHAEMIEAGEREPDRCTLTSSDNVCR
jgi:hypothetical protein